MTSVSPTSEHLKAAKAGVEKTAKAATKINRNKVYFLGIRYGAPGGSVSAVLEFEAFVAHAQVHNAFDEPDQRGDESPAKDDVENALPNAAKIELVNANAAQDQREKAGGHSVPAARRGGT
jgi:hypothetical protein